MLLLFSLIFCVTTTVSSIQELKAHAEVYGLIGDDIAKFVLQQLLYEREERAKKRDNKLNLAELQKEELQIQANKEI